MAVVKAGFKADSRNLKETFTGSWVRIVTYNTQGVTVSRIPIVEISGQVTYLACSNAPQDTCFDVMHSRLLPQLGDFYTDEHGNQYDGIIYKDRTPRFIGCQGNLWGWEITYTVEGLTSQKTSFTEQDGSEETTILDFSASVETVDEAYAADFDGKWNCNSLDFFFDDPLIYKRGVLNLSYTRQEYDNPLTVLMNYYGCINSEELWGFAPHTLLVSDITYTVNVTDQRTTYNVTYKIQYKATGWDTTKANSSYYYKSGTDLLRVLNDDGSPSENPALIAVDGTILENGDTVPSRTFRTYPEADLSELDLPSPWDL